MELNGGHVCGLIGWPHKRVLHASNNEVGRIDESAHASSQPATCGVRVLWVEPTCRREGIATRLLNAVHSVFSLKSVSKTAFLLQTLDGEQFCRAYFSCPEYHLYDYGQQGNDQLLALKS